MRSSEVEQPARALAGPPVRAILFDLDGTLLDTAEDICDAVNRALAEQHRGPLELARVRDLIGRGAPTLIHRVVARMNVHPWPIDAALLLSRFYFHYDRMHAARQHRARTYPGVVPGLRQLHGQGLGLAVVTNKPRHAAAALLAQLQLATWIDVIVGGDTLEQRKPSPQPLWHACEQLKVPPEHTLMVGDSSVDVDAARAARLRIVCVPYGYNEGASPRTLACDAFIDSVADLPALIAQRI